MIDNFVSKWQKDNNNNLDKAFLENNLINKCNNRGQTAINYIFNIDQSIGAEKSWVVLDLSKILINKYNCDINTYYVSGQFRRGLIHSICSWIAYRSNQDHADILMEFMKWLLDLQVENNDNNNEMNRFDWNSLIRSDLSEVDTQSLFACVKKSTSTSSGGYYGFGHSMYLAKHGDAIFDCLLSYQNKLISKYGVNKVNRINLKTLFNEVMKCQTLNKKDSKFKDSVSLNDFISVVSKYLNDYRTDNDNKNDLKWYFNKIYEIYEKKNENNDFDDDFDDLCDDDIKNEESFLNLCVRYDNLSLLKETFEIIDLKEWKSKINPMESIDNSKRKERYEIVRWMCEMDTKMNENIFISCANENSTTPSIINDLLEKAFDWKMLNHFWDEIDDSGCDFRKPLYSVINSGNVDVLKTVLKEKAEYEGFYTACNTDSDKSGVHRIPIAFAQSLNKSEMVNFMLSTTENRVTFLNNENGDMLDVFCIMHDIKQFCNYLYFNVIKKLNIQSWNEFEMKYLNKDGSGKKRLTMWKQQASYSAQVNKLGNEEKESEIKAKDEDKYQRFVSFLNQLDTQVFFDENIPKLMAIIEPIAIEYNNTSESTSDKSNDSNIDFSDEWFNYRRDNKIADYIYGKLSNEKDINILERLSNVINDAIKNQSCPLTDSWMLLSKKINEKDFIDSIQHACTIGMKHGSKLKETAENNDKKEEKEKEDNSVTTGADLEEANKDTFTQRQTYFKNYILPSNVFAQTVSNSNDDIDDSKKLLLLFDIIDNDVVSNELIRQKEFIKNEIIKIETNWNKEWNNIQNKIKEKNIAINSNIQQNTCIINDEINELLVTTDIMKQFGVQCKYNSINELPSSSIDQFNGSNMYDEYEFLTSLLIRSHLLNSTFQQSCYNIFENLIKIPCKFTPGTVKKRARCIVKARIGTYYTFMFCFF